MNISKNVITLMAGVFLSAGLGWSSHCGHTAEEDVAINLSNRGFSENLSKWECIEFKFINNTKTGCVVQADGQNEISVDSNKDWNFPGRGHAYSSLFLFEGCGIFHIDPCGSKHVITLDNYRSTAELAETLAKPVNTQFKAWLAGRAMPKIQFENQTNQECVVRLNEGCEYRIGAKNGETPGSYFFDWKPYPHHMVELMEGSGIMQLDDVGGGTFKVTLVPDPSVTAAANALLASHEETHVTTTAAQQPVISAEVASLADALLTTTLGHAAPSEPQVTATHTDANAAPIVTAAATTVITEETHVVADTNAAPAVHAAE